MQIETEENKESASPPDDLQNLFNSIKAESSTEEPATTYKPSDDVANLFNFLQINRDVSNKPLITTSSTTTTTATTAYQPPQAKGRKKISYS